MIASVAVFTAFNANASNNNNNKDKERPLV
jgi:hypothetical protein